MSTDGDAYTEITIGTVNEAKIVYSYPNTDALQWTLAETIEHWFNQTLQRDFLDTVIACKAQVDEAEEDKDSKVSLLLKPLASEAAGAITEYARILPAFYKAGLKAYERIPELKEKKKWDPRGKGWRFFMPLGLSMVNNKALHFFHYPPEKMLKNLQDYLNDPVPHRLENLMMACDVPTRRHAQRYECIVDGTPIAAPDDEGQAGTIPIEYFEDYQKAMVHALLRPHPDFPEDFTVPVVVFGRHPREIFAKLFLDKDDLGVNDVVLAKIVDGLLTPVIGSNHPYNFFFRSQVGNTDDPYRYIGDGRMNMGECKHAKKLMFDDLVTTGWTVAISKDPSQDIDKVLENEKAKWSGSQSANTLCALTRSQATLFYTNKEQTLFTFVVGEDAARWECARDSDETCPGIN